MQEEKKNQLMQNRDDSSHETDNTIPREDPYMKHYQYAQQGLFEVIVESSPYHQKMDKMEYLRICWNDGWEFKRIWREMSNLLKYKITTYKNIKLHLLIFLTKQNFSCV